MSTLHNTLRAVAVLTVLLCVSAESGELQRKISGIPSRDHRKGDPRRGAASPHPWCRRWTNSTFQVVIACVGDSITYGDGSHDTHRAVDVFRRGRGNYPLAMKDFLLAAVKQKAASLGCHRSPTSDQIVVKNFGVPGATLTPSKHSYMKCGEYRGALEANATFSIILLGTNDSKGWQNVSYFLRYYKELIRNMRNKSPRIPLFVLSPPPCYFLPCKYVSQEERCMATSNISCSKVRREVRRSVHAVSRTFPNITYVDVYSSLVKRCPAIAALEKLLHTPRLHHNASFVASMVSSVFGDGVHPNRNVSAEIASIVATAVLHILLSST